MKLAGRAAKFHLWLQARRQDLAAGGAKNQMEGQKNRRGVTFLKYSIGCMQQPGGPNVKWEGEPTSNGGPGTTGPQLATALSG